MKIEITIPSKILNWALESEEHKENLADVITYYVDYCLTHHKHPSFIDWLRSDKYV